jgi:hypothetical protein
MSIHLVLKPMKLIPFREISGANDFTLLSGNISAYLLQKIFCVDKILE